MRFDRCRYLKQAKCELAAHVVGRCRKCKRGYCACGMPHECERGHQDCVTCGVCPKCGAREHYFDKMVIGVFENFVLVSRFRVCIMCSERVQGVQLREPVEEKPKKGGLCSVVGCERGHHGKAWHEFPICCLHAGRIETWRRKKYPDERFPIQKCGDTLIENPDYFSVNRGMKRGTRRYKDGA